MSYFAAFPFSYLVLPINKNFDTFTSYVMAPTRNTHSSILLQLSLLLILATIFRSPPFAVAGTPLENGDSTSRNLLSATTQRKIDRPLQNCTEAATKLQCLKNSKCRWCRSEVVDDMCFTKSEAFRLPSQVFICEWFVFFVVFNLIYFEIYLNLMSF